MTTALGISLHFDGLVQDCCNSCALAIKILQYCTKPLIIARNKKWMQWKDFTAVTEGSSTLICQTKYNNARTYFYQTECWFYWWITVFQKALHSCSNMNLLAYTWFFMFGAHVLIISSMQSCSKYDANFFQWRRGIMSCKNVTNSPYKNSNTCAFSVQT